MAEVAAPPKPPEWAIRKRKTLAPAIVFKWNDLKAFVLCPFHICQKLHAHGSNRAPEGCPNSRLSHCHKSQQEYKLIWPFEADSIAEELELGFESDTDAGLWRTIGTDIEDPETEEIPKESAQGAIRAPPSEEHLLEQLNRLALNEEEYKLFISYCVTDDIEQAALCLENTNSANTFLHRKDSDGNTALTLACMEGHYDMVRFLVEQGSLIDPKNKSGKTPLIISLQYGRTEVAKYLVSHGASISSCNGSGASVLSHAKELLERLEDTRIYCHMPSLSDSSSPAKSKVITDTNGNTIIEYRQDLNRSIAMRYQEHQEKIDRVQTIISACIVHEATQKRMKKYKQNRAQKANASKVFISPSALQAMVTVFRDAYQISMADKKNTFGYLDCGEAYNIVFAVSGWRGWEFADIDGCVDRELWTERVFEFSRIVGHSLKRHEHDHLGREGSFYACHAEKQLMAFVLWHYTPLQEKPARQAPEAECARYERMNRLHQCIRNSKNSIVKCVEHCQSYRGPPVTVIRPVIYDTNAVCRDCANFRTRVLEFTGIDITPEMIR